MKRNAVLFLAVLFLAVSMATAPAWAERIERDYHETFDVRPGALLHLKHGDGDVTVTPWDQDVVEIDVRYRADIKGLRVGRESEFAVDFDHSGETIRVTGREPSFSGVGIFSSREHVYTYKIQAPKYVELRLEGDDGDASIEGWRAAVQATLEDGDLFLSDIVAERLVLELEDGDVEIVGMTGELSLASEDGDIDIRDCTSASAELRTEDGDIRLKRCAGDFGVRSNDGDVELFEMRAGTLRIETEDGDVNLDLLEARDLDLTVTTQDGTVEVHAAAGLSAELDISTGDGSIRVKSPGADLSKTKHRVTGRLGSGEGRIRITTDDGDVSLRGQ